MDSKPYSWVALDRNCTHQEHHNHYDRKPVCGDNYYDHDENVLQSGEQASQNKQISEEVIIIRDSCDINVSSVDAQVAVSVQTAVQLALVAIINLSIADNDLADQIAQDLVQLTTTKQANRQKLVIENSRDVVVSTVDADVAVAVQTLVQVLAALIIAIGIL
ncbi:spore coat protein [Bacillus xiamenensis]|uniref:Spore coat protein n=1 Tax=Bacillus xiamenensis TaxID=1178537 RepID=A0AAC9IDX2_9BACI|nr:spore coat protein [Bacillus xiamenensis]AOZ87645.1 spore coat protein [Bacillus xiamenensis]